MSSKIQLYSVGEVCPGYVTTDERIISCETCQHWQDGKCDIDLFDEILTSLDQT